MIRMLEAGPKTRPEVNEQFRNWLSWHLFGQPARIPPCSTIGVFDGENLIAVMAYYNWQPEFGVIEVSGASTSKRWLTRPVLKRLFGLPFEQWEAQLVVMRVPEKNTSLIKMLARYGFELYPIPRLRGRTEGESICTLTDDVWRSLHGQELRSETA